MSGSGKDAKLYFLSTGTRATWGTADADGVHEGAAPEALTEIKSAQDLEVPGERSAQDQTARDGDWETATGGHLAGAMEFKLAYRKTDAGREALLKALRTNLPVPLAILSGDKATADVEGMWADFTVLKCKPVHPLKEASGYEVSIVPAPTDVPPEFVRVTAGA